MHPAKLPCGNPQGLQRTINHIVSISIVPELLSLHSGEISAPASVPHVSRVSFSLGER